MYAQPIKTINKNNAQNMKEILNRIADALERIADALEQENNKNTKYFLNSTVATQKDIDSNCDKQEECVKHIAERTNENIISFLNDRNVSIKTLPKIEENITELDNITRFMGEKFSHITKVYNCIKRDLNAQRGFSLNIKNFSQLEISMSCQFCTLLSRIAFLEQYTYRKSPNFNIYAKASCTPMVINYLNGHWLEKFVVLTVIDIVNELGIANEFAYILNPQIILPNGDDFELDCLFDIKGEIFWVEAKTGNFQQYIHKYSKIANSIIGVSNSFMVLAEQSFQNSDSKGISKIYGLNVCYVENFKNEFKQVIIASLKLSDIDTTTSIIIDNNTTG